MNMPIRKISVLELFANYEKATAAYMKANGKFVVVPPVTGAEAALVNDAREQVQMYRNALIARLQES